MRSKETGTQTEFFEKRADSKPEARRIIEDSICKCKPPSSDNKSNTKCCCPCSESRQNTVYNYYNDDDDEYYYDSKANE